MAKPFYNLGNAFTAGGPISAGGALVNNAADSFAFGMDTGAGDVDWAGFGAKLKTGFGKFVDASKTTPYVKKAMEMQKMNTVLTNAGITNGNIKTLVGTLQNPIKNIKSLGKGMNAAMKGVKAGTAEVSQGIMAAKRALGIPEKTFMQKTADFFTKMWNRIYEVIFKPISEFFGSIWDKIVGVFKLIGEKLYQWIGKPFMDYIYNPIKGALGSKVGGSDVTWGNVLLVGLLVLAAAAVMYYIVKWVYAKYKNWRAKSSGRVRESYINTLNRQSFIEAKNVASFLKENTSMSKKECNKVANYVYKSSLTRKINNLI